MSSNLPAMSKKRIVVAGGTGFLGSRICKSAVARGWEVTSLRYHLLNHVTASDPMV